ncbi:hypothetical protein COU53_03255 [Candidatus Pacearchaeota archaeon CG10_big_fil_rev_8_21_14_0_10_30_48]|nr:MAG: hypothetical protein COU53_03255 [Candidatus Pacearchaeota archaeon CG10_big_fil_rev_8_21_14_0_10_30_48]
MVKYLKIGYQKILIISFIVLSILFLLSFLFHNNNNNSTNKVCFKEKCFKVEIANNEMKRSQGLMFRQILSENEGMLFVFPKEDNYNFWMKNTLIPLDIIWISKNEEIVFIEKNVLSCKEDPCQIYTSPKKALYVLEINSGQTEEIGINIGDKIMIS